MDKFENKLKILIIELRKKYPILVDVRTDWELDMYTDNYRAIEFEIPKADGYNYWTDKYDSFWAYIKFSKFELENKDLLKLTEDKFEKFEGMSLTEFIETKVRRSFIIRIMKGIKKWLKPKAKV